MSARPSVAVVGCGYWGKNLVRDFSALGALSAVCDRDPVTADRYAHDFGVKALTFDEVLADSSLAGIIVSAPAAEHFQIALAALQADKHVLVEKPLALQVEDAETLCAEADARGLTLMVGHLLQYHPAFLALKAMLDEGVLGRLQYIYSNRLNLGKVRHEENILWSFAPHDISMIIGLVRAEPTSVWATGSRYLNRDIEDVTMTHLSFSSGVNAHIFVSWLHPVKEQKLVVVADRGMAIFDDGQSWNRKLQLYRHRVDWLEGRPHPVRADAEPIEIERSEPLLTECAHFLDCLVSGATPWTDGREGVRVLKILADAQSSLMADNGQPSQPPMGVPRGTFVHETAYLDSPSTVGAGTHIWHFSHVLSGSSIGRDCTIGQNVAIGPNVSVGDGCKIQNNVSLYEGVTLESDVFCGPSCVFTNVLNPRSQVSRRDEYRRTIVRRGATIGANATIVCGHEIGEFSFVGAGAVVTTDVPPHALVAGVPAVRIGWVSHAGEPLGPDLTCPRTGRCYREVSGALEEVTAYRCD